MNLASILAMPDRDQAEGTSATRAPGRRAVPLALLAIWLAFSYPALAGKARFPFYFSSPDSRESNPSFYSPNLESGDAYFSEYPWHVYLGQNLRNGRIPLWDPHRFAGTPIAANSTTGTFYPPNWIYASNNFLVSVTVISLASILAALFIAYWFFRVLDLVPYAAGVGAIAFVFSAFLIKWSAHGSVFGSAMWLPLALGGLSVAWNGRPVKGLLIAAAALGLSILAGHPQVSLYVWLIAGLWALIHGVNGVLSTRDKVDPKPMSGVAFQMGIAVGAFVLAAALSAVQLIPTAEVVKHTIRGSASYSRVMDTRLPPEHLPTFFIPDFRGNPIDGTFRGPGLNFTETALYPGILMLPLAFIGLFHRPRRLAFAFALVFLIGLLATLGTPLYRLFFALPLFSRTLFVTRFILLIDFGLAGLAALGMQALILRTRSWLMPALVGACCVVAIAVGITVLTGSGPSLPYVTTGGLGALALLSLGAATALLAHKIGPTVSWTWLVLLLVIATDLWLFGFRLNTFGEPMALPPNQQQEAKLPRDPNNRLRYTNSGWWWIAPNGALVNGAYDIGGYDPFILKRTVDLLSLSGDNVGKTANDNFVSPFSPKALKTPVMDLMGVGMVAEGPQPGQPSQAFRTRLRQTAFPPAFLVHCVRQVPARSVLNVLSRMTSSELSENAVIEDGTTINAPALNDACDEASSPAKVNSYTAENIEIQTDSGKAGILVLSDAWYPGWEVTVDRRAEDLLRVDHGLRGVELDAGQHLVEFSFRPKSVRYGALISVGAGLVYLSNLVWMLVRHRKKFHSGNTNE